MKKDEISTFFYELREPNCHICGQPKVISDWIDGFQFSKITGERYHYKTFGCPNCDRTKESLISCYTSGKEKADKMLNRKLYGYKINFTNMGIIKNTIKVIVILLALFLIVNVFWGLFGGIIKQIKIPQIFITKKVEVPVEIIKEVPTEIVKDCDIPCAIKILESSYSHRFIGTAIDQNWSCERKFLKQMNCSGLPSPHPKQECEAEYDN